MSEKRAVWIWSTNETPKRGSGLRRVLALVEGPWVRLYPVKGPGDPDKMRLETFERILVE